MGSVTKLVLLILWLVAGSWWLMAPEEKRGRRK
jgi:hypothetical protein